MNTYKVIWEDDCYETHESLIEADFHEEAEDTIWSRYVDCMNVHGSIKL